MLRRVTSRTWFRALGLTLLLLVAGALGTKAEATTFDPVEAACPVCEHGFTALRVRSANSFGGVDVDLCLHSRGGQPLSCSLWTCPMCRFTRLAGEFERPVTDAVRTWVRNELKSPVEIAADARQNQIPGWVKAHLALAVCERESPRGAGLARILRHAVFIERVESSQSKRPIRDDPELKEIDERIGARAFALDALAPRDRAGGRTVVGRDVTTALRLLEEAATLEGVPRDVTLLYAACSLRTHGEFAPAIPVFERLSAGEASPKPIRAVAAAQLDSIEREKRLLGRLVEEFARDRKPEKARNADEASLAYLIADAHRRLGDDASAARWLDAGLGSEAMSATERVLAREAASFAHQEGSAYARIVAQHWPKWIESLVASLADDETSESGVETLQLLGSFGAEPKLAKLLGHEDPALRLAAVMSLRSARRPSDSTLERLRARILDKDEDDDVRWEGVDTLMRFGVPSDLGLCRVLLADPEWFLVDVPVATIGLMGDATDVPRLLAIREDNEEVVGTALSLLTGRDASDPEAFDAWWAKHKKSNRAAWLEAAFEEHIPKPEDLSDRTNVPALIDLLENEHAYLRINAFRTLSAIGKTSQARALVLDEGRIRMGSLEEPPPLRDIIGDGVVLYFQGRPAFDLDAMDGQFGRILRRPYAEASWSRAAAVWKDWWAREGAN